MLAEWDLWVGRVGRHYHGIGEIHVRLVDFWYGLEALHGEAVGLTEAEPKFIPKSGTKVKWHETVGCAPVSVAGLQDSTPSKSSKTRQVSETQPTFRQELFSPRCCRLKT